MRPPRLIVLLACFFALPVLLTFVSLLRSHPRQPDSSSEPAPARKNGFRALFSFSTPSSLFPPSAIISLTDDNSTFFLARPAAFGPLLPSNGLSGRLWVGSGFGDDNTGRGGGASARAEGELGCSDVPGWGDGNRKTLSETKAAVTKSSKDGSDGTSKHAGSSDGSGSGRSKRTTPDERKIDNLLLNADDSIISPSRDDGTDDHLHHPLPSSHALKSSRPGEIAQKEPSDTNTKSSHHADIQSLQEGAEIAGHIVLLSRGGCGFLEKVKWVQRRGGIALIVGDNTRGGGLVTMYAQGDTSNVTIPSLFTSHTTAHLLSSLIPSEGILDDSPSGISPNPNSRESDKSKVKASQSKKQAAKQAKDQKDGPTFTPARSIPKSTTTGRPTTKTGGASTRADPSGDTPFQVKESVSWLRSVLSKVGIGTTRSNSDFGHDSRRPPSSGQLDWVLVDDWTEDEAPSAGQHSSSSKAGSKEVQKAPKNAESHDGVTAHHSEDDFVIGVQDWRDPDLVGLAPSKDTSVTTKISTRLAQSSAIRTKAPMPTSSQSTVNPNRPAAKGAAKEGSDAMTLEGGSITPGSGEYGEPRKIVPDKSKTSKQDAWAGSAEEPQADLDDESGRGWLDRLSWFGKDDKSHASDTTPVKDGVARLDYAPVSQDADDTDLLNDDNDMPGIEHDGLWVTLSPTNMSTSPFFDTLLVLVISPLVTLTVVYALLLLRSRIRRRRWRAPKSVVERLPVRTYQTISLPTSATSSSTPTPASTSPSSPLLQTHPTSTPRSRPRSRTASSLPVQSEGPISSPISLQARSPAGRAEHEREKSRIGSPGWRRRYTGKQLECVVCLEEYISGVSRVMSLPCGHEFHADCM